MMKCKLATKTKGCYLKACTKRRSGCPYEYGPSDIPLTLPDALYQRRFDALLEYWRVITANQSSYDAGFKAALSSLLGSFGSEFWPLGDTPDARRAHRLGVEEGLKAREDDERDLERRARWEKGAVRRGEMSESECEYYRRR